jgi:hypothetical protein
MPVFRGALIPFNLLEPRYSGAQRVPKLPIWPGFLAHQAARASDWRNLGLLGSAARCDVRWMSQCGGSGYRWKSGIRALILPILTSGRPGGKEWE